MNIIIYTDNIESWFVEYGKKLQTKIENLGHTCSYVFNKEDLFPCDINFILSCTKIVPPEKLHFNRHNIVVHASDLPNGKGFSPLQWQILEGKNEIPLTLFEAIQEIDAGPYYIKSSIKCDGTELLEELRHKMAVEIIEMCVNFIVNFKKYKPIIQIGEESFYKRRKVKDDEIDINKTIKEQFNHLRIADNENYPLYFIINNTKYYLKIFKP